MTARDLLADLRREGFAVSIEAGGVRIAPKERVDNHIRAEIRACKADILALLAAEHPSPSTAESHPRPSTPTIDASRATSAGADGPPFVEPCPERCYLCGGADFWQRGADQLCQACHPDPKTPMLAGRLVWAPAPGWSRQKRGQKRRRGVLYGDEVAS